ncbi:hypothetical protein CWE15_03460 [Aliidiomarina taiwanensis]|uniref:Anti-sigma-E factor RseA n=1 Tax=Aliidiomarina taiwanensis TaxID=946228 RepID=A0A432XA11_9GAMM|nr:RseA family anti-sigma factor [Aliidiomarina taiwanensis]RUO44238.1 hypothetical protein CWE15_03460 [Aliidiomarina taiwanensis]
MTERQYETLSALMDSELDTAQERASLDNLVRDDALRQKWHNYHLIRAAMRNEVKQDMPLDISAAVAAQVANEPIPFAPKHGLARKLALKKWLKPAANMAIAASVALVTVLGVTQYQRIDDGSLPEQAVASPGFQPTLQTVPLGVIGNPVSYNAAQPQTSLTAQQQARLQSQVQAFMLDHQLQLQWSGALNEAALKEQQKQEESDVKEPNTSSPQ